MATTINLFVIGSAEWMAIGNTVVTCFTGFLLARIYQSSLSKSRRLKDILIEEVEGIRKEYQHWLAELYDGNIDTGSVKAWLKLMGIRIEQLSTHVPAHYRVNTGLLQPYRLKLHDMIVDSEEFDRQYKASSQFTPSDEFRRKLIMFQQEHGHSFTQLIIAINNA